MGKDRGRPGRTPAAAHWGNEGMQLPSELTAVTWNPGARVCDFVFNGDGGVRAALEALAKGMKAVAWSDFDPDTAQRLAPKRGSGWVRGTLDSLNGGPIAKQTAALVKDLQRLETLAGQQRDRIGSQIVRHSPVLADTSKALDGIGTAAATMAATIESRILLARKDLKRILDDQEALEIHTGSGAAFDSADPSAVGLVPGNQSVIFAETLKFKQTKYLECDPMSVEVRVAFLSDKDPRHRGALEVMKIRTKQRVAELVAAINEGIVHFDKTLAKKIDKGEITDKREIADMVVAANVMVKQAVLTFEQGVPADLEKAFLADKLLGKKLKTRKKLAVAKAVGGAIIATAVALAAIAASGVGIAASVTGAVATFGGLSPLVIASICVSAVGILGTAAGAVGAWVNVYQKAQRNENMAEKKLLSTYSDLRTYLDKKAKAQQKGGLSKLASDAQNLVKGYAKTCEKAKVEHWMHCQRMVENISDLEVKIADLAKGKAEAEKKLGEAAAKLAKSSTKDPKAEALAKATRKELAQIQGLVDKIDDERGKLAAIQKAVLERLERKMEFHAELEKLIREANAGKDVQLTKVDAAWGRITKAVDDLKPVIAAAKTIGGHIAKIYSGLKLVEKNMRALQA